MLHIIKVKLSYPLGHRWKVDEIPVKAEHEEDAIKIAFMQIANRFPSAASYISIESAEIDHEVYRPGVKIRLKKEAVHDPYTASMLSEIGEEKLTKLLEGLEATIVCYSISRTHNGEYCRVKIDGGRKTFGITPSSFEIIQ